jgi:hypothetical protein
MGQRQNRPAAEPASTGDDVVAPARPAVTRGGGITGSNRRRPRFQGSKRWTSLRLMGSSRWGSNQLLSAIVDRLCIWLVTGAASIMLIGDVMTFRHVMYDDHNIDNDYLKLYGILGLVISVVCLVFEVGANALFESQLVVTIIAVLLSSLGVTALLTMFFGDTERASVVIAGLGLLYGGGALISDEVEAFRKRLENVCGNVPNGTPGFLLVLSSVCYVVVSCVSVSKPLVTTYGSLPAAIGLQLGSVTCALFVFFSSCYLLASGTSLGRAQKYCYLALTIVISVAASLFPEASLTKQISVTLTLMSMVGFSSVCTLNLFNRQYRAGK